MRRSTVLCSKAGRASPHRAFLARFIPLVLGLAVSGCKQSNGERCQLNSDCASGICAIRMGGSGLPEGTCQATATLPMDTGVRVDTGVRDGGAADVRKVDTGGPKDTLSREL